MENKSTGSAGPLLAEFPPVTVEAWRALVEAELKGVPFDKKMLSSTYEGITLRPIYQQADVANLPHLGSLPGYAPFVRGASAAGYVGKPWDVSQEIKEPDPAVFNDTAQASLQRGLTALNIVLDQATRRGADPDWAKPAEVGTGGLSIASLADLDRALQGIDLERVPLFVRAGASGMPFAALLAALARIRRKDIAKLRGCIEIDPLGVLAHDGALPQSLGSAYREMAALTSWAATHAPQLQTLCVHSRAWHEAGSNAVQELAFTIAMGLEYLRELSARGVPVDVSAPRLRFAMTVGTQFFTEIAKLRALRMLWARVVQAAGGNADAQRCRIHVRTSLWNKTVYDPYVNMLRSTVEAFAGAIGGCESMQVGAFDEAIRTPDDFSERVARNTQLVLQAECQLDRVIDPAGGSWYVESLTDELARRSWTLFQEVEKRGGMARALSEGWPQAAVAKTAEEKRAAVARRRDSVIGTNQYANATEKPLETRSADSAVFHRRRMQQVAAARTEADDANHQAVLERLSGVVAAAESSLMEAAVQAASSGATLGEITRAVRIQDQAPATITPVTWTRVSVGFENLRRAVEQHATKMDRKPRMFLANLGPPKQYRARADFSRAFLEVAGFEVVNPNGFATPEEAAAAAIQAGADAVCVCSTDETYPALIPPLAAAWRAQKPGQPLILAGYPTDQLDAHRAAGVEIFIHIRANALEVLSQIASRLGIKL